MPASSRELCFVEPWTSLTRQSTEQQLHYSRFTAGAGGGDGRTMASHSMSSTADCGRQRSYGRVRTPWTGVGGGAVAQAPKVHLVSHPAVIPTPPTRPLPNHRRWRDMLRAGRHWWDRTSGCVSSPALGHQMGCDGQWRCGRRRGALAMLRCGWKTGCLLSARVLVSFPLEGWGGCRRRPIGGPGRHACHIARCHFTASYNRDVRRGRRGGGMLVEARCNVKQSGGIFVRA